MSKPASVAIKAQRETAWRNRLARFAASKLTVEAFCRREAVPVGTFYGWQAWLRTRDGNVGALPQRVVALSPSPLLDLGPVNGLASRATSPVRDHAPHHVQSSHPYDYFVDVLQRVGQHPASLVHQLTPRLWKQLFADNPLRSDLYDLTTRRNDAG